MPVSLARPSGVLCLALLVAPACSSSSTGGGAGTGDGGGGGSGSGASSASRVASTPDSSVPATPTTNGNPDGHCPVPTVALAEDVSSPTTVVGTGTAASCTADAVVAAVAAGGVVTFACGPDP